MHAITGSGPARSGVTLLARILGNNGNPVTQASVSSINYQVTNLSAGTTGTATALTVADVIFDSLQQNDLRWTKDDADHPGIDGRHGFNFAATIPRTQFAAATPAVDTPDPVKYQIDVLFTPTTGQAFTQRFLYTAQPVYQ